MSSKSKIVFAVLITFSVTCIIFTLVLGLAGITPYGGGLQRLRAVVGIIDGSYIGEYDRDEAEDSAINAYVASIGDPYTVYYDSESAQSLINAVEGSYVGIGIEVFSDPETKEIIVLCAYEGSPAKRAGIKSGDVLVSIDGVLYDGESMDDAVSCMKGAGMENPVGTEMEITVRRDGELLNLTVRREEINLYEIEQRVVGDNLLYLRYTGFSADSAEELSEILENADEVYNGIILDLRENSGGDLEAAIDVCDIFLDDGLIMYTEDKYGNRREYKATSGSCSLPLAVLTDGGSASASEIVAGCIQARERGVIIGEKTYGKGVSQLIYSLGKAADSGMIKITGYKNYRPDGIWLNEAVTPDIEIASDAAFDEYGNIVFDLKEDRPLLKAIEELNP